MKAPHESVLVGECLDAFAGIDIAVFVDGTLGAGGHAQKVLAAHPEVHRLVGIDQDSYSLEVAGKRLSRWKDKVQYIEGNFSDLDKHLDACRIGEIDGMLLDLGVSSMQLEESERGFSFSKDGPLDMRMDHKGELTAADIVNTWSEKELGRVFRDYGEVRRWRAAAKTIVLARKEQPILRTGQLVGLLQSLLTNRKKTNIHPLTLIFQALRICVNQELEKLEMVIPQAIRRLRPGGRLAVMSFHSLEDRIVKNAFRYASSDKETTSGIAGVFLSKKPEVGILTKKPIIPSSDEMHRNPRSRSARLRVIEKLADH
ncbi:MAG: 16S rRNA (cytosine(1402)-N(4))-methyltransferase RsmH [Waddliaceae bacterium]